MSDRDALVTVRKELAYLVGIVDAQLAGTQPPGPVDPPPPPYVPPVITGPSPPPRAGLIIGPELAGKGNPSMQSSIPGNCVVAYKYVVQIGDSALEFRVAGQSQNGTPPDTWAWVSHSPGGNPITPYEHVSGANVGVCTVPSSVIGQELWINEQPSEVCNRYAQVNAGAGLSTRGR